MINDDDGNNDETQSIYLIIEILSQTLKRNSTHEFQKGQIKYNEFNKNIV